MTTQCADVLPSEAPSSAAAAADWAVELRGIHKTYYTHHFFAKEEEGGKRRIYERKTIDAVKDVSFGIERGEVLGLLGPNGAGKTTCVKMISGLVRPSQGKVFVEGMHVERKRLSVLRHVGVVLEGTRTVIWPLTPYENLVYFGRLRGVHGKWVRKRARELCDFIGLKDKINTQVRRLSRGQRQRLAICIALIADPTVILLDEPTTGLDVQSSRAIREKVGQMAREMNKSVLLTTHDMFVAQRMCDRIGIIDKGGMVTLQPTAELLEVFAEQTYEMRLDAVPDIPALEDIEGMHHVSVQPPEADGSITVVMELASDAEVRSAALYSVAAALQGQGRRLLSVSQRQQTLENVFLRLTETTI